MRKYIVTIVLALSAISGWACTNVMVGKKASVDGSVMCSYNNDGYGGYATVDILPGGEFAKGTKVPLSRWQWAVPDTIMQAEHVYRVVHRINEYQVTIGETTFDGRPELVNPEGMINYPQLMELGLQRAKTAREAIKVMAQMVEEYGYNSSGETFSVCDKNEAWIMEIIGKGPGNKGAVWAAIRIPDDCICVHANQSRIDKIPFGDKENCMYSKDVVKFAREKGYFTGKDKDFSFCDAYCPIDMSGRRFCEARVWSIMSKWGDKELMEPYLKFVTGESDVKLPLYIRPKQKLSVRDVKNAMRDHFEGTPLSLEDDCSWGPYCSPYRPSPIIYKVDGNEYHHERTVGCAVSIYSMVAQMRDWLPDDIGGVLWYGADDANGVAYVPFYCTCERVPDAFDDKRSEGGGSKFSFKSAFWMCNWVSNMVYQRYNLMIDDLRLFRDGLDDDFENRQASIEKEALALYNDNPAKAREMLTGYTEQCTTEMMDTWMQLAQFLIVKYNDFKVLESEGKEFKEGWGHFHNYPVSEEFRRQAVNTSGDRFRVRKKEDNNVHQDVMSK